MNSQYIAHFRPKDREVQSVAEHLSSVAALCRNYGDKIGLGTSGEVIGLVHDLGKFSHCFQSYLQSGVGLLDQDADGDFVDAKKLKGRIDHSTAGAQLIWRRLNGSPIESIVGQFLAICVASHHSGLIDCIGGAGEKFGDDLFTQRMGKREEKAHLEEVLRKWPSTLSKRFDQLISSPDLVAGMKRRIGSIIKSCDSDCNQAVRTQTGLLARYLFSCLLDADRTDTAAFAEPFHKYVRGSPKGADFELLILRFESFLDQLPTKFGIDGIRQRISSECLHKAKLKRGIYSLSVPTGGGKTLASLRFAIHHAKEHALDRIYFVIPYTSIIDQNAELVRKALEKAGDTEVTVLEHHSNLMPEQQSWRQKILAESWDAPIVFTTMVQFLESLFGGGTRGARRMHQLANAVIVFDEIQSLPTNCVHLFNNAINFLTEQCGSTAVMCTATQPLLHTVDPGKGALNLTPENEIIADVRLLFDELRRVEIHDRTRPQPWTPDDVAKLIRSEAERTGSCLAIVNTKRSARALFDAVGSPNNIPVIHLSTNMCPNHRKRLIRIVRDRLDKRKPTICISTQLIEAGVDVDFGSVIRYIAGLDSIAQAAGRCNRNGEQNLGAVHVVNPSNESLGRLPDIKLGASITRRILQDFKEDPERFDGSLVSTAAISWFYKQFFHQRTEEMSYPVGSARIGHDDTVLNLLGNNTSAVSEFAERMEQNGQPAIAPEIYLRQAFTTAAREFKVIDAPTRGVICPFGWRGRTLVADLYAAETPGELFPLLRRAQQFTVNVFDHTLRTLNQQNALTNIQEGVDLLCLDERFYHIQFGLADEPVGTMEFWNA